ncbi:hypothetical protein NA57DRAFT_38341, partial [Rhizodiscina lignyota]
AQSAMDTVQNHPMTQNVTNGPVGEKVKEEKDKTASEFRDLADSRTTPEQPAATGQPLTHYHSMFYRLLSWKNPRATGISFVSAVVFIFMCRYLNILRYIFRGLYTVLGITAAAEVVGKSVFGNGFTSQIRPKRYMTIPKESLERFTDDVEQLINFFVIEFQRIVFAENIYVTVGAFFSAFISYYLIKWLPVWGLSLLATCLLYLCPLIYIQNKELIDAQLNQANDLMSKQAAQVREMTGQYTSKAGEQMRTYATQAQKQAQGLMGQAKQKAGYAAPAQDRIPPHESDFPKAPANDIEPPKEEAAEKEGAEPVAA